MRVDPVREYAGRARLVREISPVWIVRVEDRGLRYALVGARREQLEEDRLRVEIALQRAVKVEVFRREGLEHRDVDLASANLAQRQRVRGRLEHPPPAARDEELGEELLDLDRLLRALPRVVRPFVAGKLEVHRRRESRPLPGRLEHVRDEVHGRRLAVGAGDADELQLARRVIEQLRGKISE